MNDTTPTNTTPSNSTPSSSKDVVAAVIVILILAVGVVGLLSHHPAIFYFGLLLAVLAIVAFAAMRMLKVW